MTAPTLNNYFDVSSWMYGYPDSNAQPPNPAGLTPFYYAPGQFDSGLYDETGFHAAAFITGGDDPTVIIGFEGTDSSGILQRPAFLEAQVEADLALFFGYVPEALTQAVGFARTVVAAAQAANPKANLVVTGHSLGAAEAAYVSTRLGLGGARPSPRPASTRTTSSSRAATSPTTSPTAIRSAITARRRGTTRARSCSTPISAASATRPTSTSPTAPSDRWSAGC